MITLPLWSLAAIVVITILATSTACRIMAGILPIDEQIDIERYRSYADTTYPENRME